MKDAIPVPHGFDPFLCPDGRETQDPSKSTPCAQASISYAGQPCGKPGHDEIRKLDDIGEIRGNIGNTGEYGGYRGIWGHGSGHRGHMHNSLFPFPGSGFADAPVSVGGLARKPRLAAAFSRPRIAPDERGEPVEKRRVPEKAPDRLGGAQGGDERRGRCRRPNRRSGPPLRDQGAHDLDQPVVPTRPDAPLRSTTASPPRARRPRPDPIQGDVPRRRHQVVLIHDDRGKARLKEMAGHPVARVDEGRIAPVRLAERPAKPLGRRGRQDEMDVVGHRR